MRPSFRFPAAPWPGAAAAAAGVRAAGVQWLRQLQRAGWGALWLGTGLWRMAAACAERFVVDLQDNVAAQALPREQELADWWGGPVVRRLWERAGQVVRRCHPRVAAHRRLARRADEAIHARLRHTEA